MWLTPGEGGLLLSADGRVQVEVPPGAVSRRTLLRYLPQPPVGETPAWLTMFFDLEAQDEQGAAVTQFEALVHLTYRFPASAALTETMRLYQWVDATGAWQALDSQMDVPGRQLTAGFGWRRAVWPGRTDIVQLRCAASADGARVRDGRVERQQQPELPVGAAARAGWAGVEPEPELFDRGGEQHPPGAAEPRW